MSEEGRKEGRRSCGRTSLVSIYNMRAAIHEARKLGGGGCVTVDWIRAPTFHVQG